MTRRTLIKIAGLTGAGLLARQAKGQSSAIPLFDGKTLDGWQQIENSATSLSAAGIKDTATFATWLSDGTDAMSVYLRTRLPESLKKDLSGWQPTDAKAK